MGNEQEGIDWWFYSILDKYNKDIKDGFWVDERKYSIAFGIDDYLGFYGMVSLRIL